MTANIPRLIPSMAHGASYLRPTAAPLLRPMVNTTLAPPSLYTPLLQSSARLQPHRFQAPPPPRVSYTITRYPPVPYIQNFTPNYGVTVRSPEPVPQSPVPLSPHALHMRQRISSIYDRMGMQPPVEIRRPPSPPQSPSRVSFSPAPRVIESPPLSPRTSASIERHYARLSSSRESSLDRGASVLQAPSLRIITREPQTLSRANSSRTSFHAVPMNSNGSVISSRPLNFGTPPISPRAPQIISPSPVVTTRQPLFNRESSSINRSHSTPPVFTPAPGVARNQTTDRQNPENVIEESLSTVENQLEAPIENTESCSRLGRILSACSNLVSRLGLFQFSARVEEANQLLTGIKESLEIEPPSAPALATPRSLSPSPSVTETAVESTPASSSIGSILIPSASDITSAKVDKSHLQYPIREMHVPDSPMTFNEAANFVIRKAHPSQLDIDLGNPYQDQHCFISKLQQESDFQRTGSSYWKPKILKMFKNIIHRLSNGDRRAQITGDERLQEEVNEKCRVYFSAFQVGSGDCNDPMNSAIEECYKNLTCGDASSMAPTSFEEKVQIAAREFRDSTFDETCTDYMRNCRSQRIDQASGLRFFRNKLQARLSLSPTENTHFEGICSRYADHTDPIARKFQEKYTAKELVKHLCGTNADSKAYITHQEILDFLAKKTNVDKQEIDNRICGLDEDLMPTGSPISKESLVMMVLRNLDKPMIA